MTQDFIERIHRVHGEEGEAWLQQIPQCIAFCEKKWSITVESPFPNLNYNYVAHALRKNGEKVVLKIGFPKDREYISEMYALQDYNGQGAIRLLEYDYQTSVSLLEYADPGKRIRGLEDVRAVEIAIGIMRQLWKETPQENSHYLSVNEWGEGFARYQKDSQPFGIIPHDMFEKASRIFDEQLKTQKELVLLHGDLHHDNILSAAREPYLAIDPKGVIGEREYEIGAFLRNPYPEFTKYPNVRQLTKRRIDQFSSELNLDKKRIKNWAFAQTVLSAIWAIEEKWIGWEYYLSCAQILESI